jgi:hypothetical protein
MIEGTFLRQEEEASVNLAIFYVTLIVLSLFCIYLQYRNNNMYVQISVFSFTQNTCINI